MTEKTTKTAAGLVNDAGDAAPERPAARAPEAAAKTDATARPAMRADARPPSAKDAAARAKEIMGHLNDDVAEGADKYYVDKSIIPDGWTYEWKRRTVFNKEDPAYTVALRRMGWTEVPAARHPDMMPVGHDGPIERDGLVLMERPTEIVRMVQASDLKTARSQVRAKEEQLNQAPPQHFSRTENPQTAARITKGYETVPIPE